MQLDATHLPTGRVSGYDPLSRFASRGLNSNEIVVLRRDARRRNIYAMTDISMVEDSARRSNPDESYVRPSQNARLVPRKQSGRYHKRSQKKETTREENAESDGRARKLDQTAGPDCDEGDKLPSRVPRTALRRSNTRKKVSPAPARVLWPGQPGKSKSKSRKRGSLGCCENKRNDQSTF